MEKSERLKPIGALLLCLFAIPLLGWLTGVYAERNYETQFRDIVVNKQKLVTAADYDARGLSYIGICEKARTQPADDDIKEFCSDADEIRYVKLSSYGTAAIGVLLFVLIIGGRIVGGTNRKRLSLIFGPLVRIVMLLLAISVLAQGALLIYSIYTIEVTAIQRVHGGILLLLGIGALAACWMLLKSSVMLLRSQPMLLRATALGRAQHGDFFDFVNGLASKLKAEAPDHIVVGLEPNFFVTASDVKLAGTDLVLRGRTLFVSLGLLHVFSLDELAAVVGHELGHFRGGDVAYSMKFAPIYSRLAHALGNLGQTTGSAAADLGRLPAVVALSVCLLEFASAERSIGRERELQADKAGAEAADAHALARALVKVSLYGSQWSVLTKANIDALSEGRMFTNLAQTYAALCAETTAELDWAAVQDALGKSVQPHPVDTHPPLLQRLQNLNTALADMSPQQLAAPENPASALLPGAGPIEEELSNLEVRWLAATGAVVIPATATT